MSAEGEKVVADADRPGLQDLLPEADERMLHGVARRDPVHFPGSPRCGQGGTVDLAVRSQRPGGERHEGGRQHVLGQMAAQEVTELRVRRGLLACGQQIADEVLVAAWAIRADDDQGLAHAGMSGEDRLDLSRLDAEAADLDLLIDAAEELDRAVRPPG